MLAEMLPDKDEDILRFTQEARFKLVKNLIVDGQMPDDPKVAKVLLTGLKDMDGQVQTRQRLQQDNANAQADRDVAVRAARVVDSIRRQGGNPFAAGNEHLLAGLRNTNQADDSQLPEIEVVEGHLEIGAVQENYDQFMERVEGTGA